MKEIDIHKKGFIADSIPYRYSLYASPTHNVLGSAYITLYTDNGSILIEGHEVEPLMKMLQEFISMVKKKHATALLSDTPPWEETDASE